MEKGPPILQVWGPSLRTVFLLREGETLTVGRAPGSDVLLLNLAISRRHGCVRLEEGRLFAVDLGSHNGMFLGPSSEGQRMKPNKPYWLASGEIISLCGHILRFLDEPGIGFDGRYEVGEYFVRLLEDLTLPPPSLDPLYDPVLDETFAPKSPRP